MFTTIRICTTIRTTILAAALVLTAQAASAQGIQWGHWRIADTTSTDGTKTVSSLEATLNTLQGQGWTIFQVSPIIRAIGMSSSATGGCPGTAPFSGAVCQGGGWVPGSSNSGSGSTSGCFGSAPFAGAVCQNGGWVPGSSSSSLWTIADTLSYDILAYKTTVPLTPTTPSTPSTPEELPTCTDRTGAPAPGWVKLASGGWVPPSNPSASTGICKAS